MTAPQQAKPIEIARRGLMLVISSPSGAGKSTIARNLLEADSGVSLSVSVTTRQRRPSEIAGRHYHFIDRAEFEMLRDSDALLEWAEVHGNFYGTPVPLRLLLSNSRPGNLGIGKNDRRDGQLVEFSRSSQQMLDCCLCLMGRFVGQHRLTGDISDGQNVRIIGLLASVTHHESPSIRLHLRLLETQTGGAWAAPDRNENAIKSLRAVFTRSLEGRFHRPAHIGQ